MTKVDKNNFWYRIKIYNTLVDVSEYTYKRFPDVMALARALNDTLDENPRWAIVQVDVTDVNYNILGAVHFFPEEYKHQYFIENPKDRLLATHDPSIMRL